MENSYKYTVAGHTFQVTLPDGYAQETHLAPYLPFIEEGDVAPLFSLTLATTDDLKSLDPGKVRQCLNDEAPYFWMFEKEDGLFNFGFSYSKKHPDCILIRS